MFPCLKHYTLALRKIVFILCLCLSQDGFIPANLIFLFVLHPIGFYDSILNCIAILAIILTGPTIESKDSNNQWLSLFFYIFFQFKLAPSVEE